MADKELRRMNRTELIEIIYALQQNEQKLREENDEMAAELEDRKIRMDESGSIAEAALSLNHIFEDAQSAADQYLLSLKSREEKEQAEPEQNLPEKAETESGGSETKTEEAEPEPDGEDGQANPESEKILEDAHRQADQILEDARRQADDILAAAREEAQAESRKTLDETNEQCAKERRAVKDYHDRFLRDMSDILKSNPELLARVQKMGTVEGD